MGSSNYCAAIVLKAAYKALVREVRTLLLGNKFYSIRHDFLGFDKMPSWIQTVVLDWLAKLTFSAADVRKVKQDNEEKAAKFLELFKTRRTTGVPYLYRMKHTLTCNDIL